MFFICSMSFDLPISESKLILQIKMVADHPLLSSAGTDNEAQGEVTERTDSRFPLRHYSQRKKNVPGHILAPRRGCFGNHLPLRRVRILAERLLSYGNEVSYTIIKRKRILQIKMVADHPLLSSAGTDNEAQGEVTERTDSRFPLRHYSQRKKNVPGHILAPRRGCFGNHLPLRRVRILAERLLSYGNEVSYTIIKRKRTPAAGHSFPPCSNFYS